EFDVVIIGSGFAALAASVKASEKGYKILIVEKMGRLGGNSVINGGLAAFPHNPLQEKEGVKDSNELFIQDCLKAGLNINHKDLLDTIASRAKDALALTLKCGVQYRDRLEHLGGHSVPRTYGTTNGSGSGIVLPMIEYVKKIDKITIKTRTKFDEFILDDGGRVVGIKAREEYKFDKNLMDDDRENKSGTVKFFKASKGVVLASGGFCRDVFYRQVQDPRLDKDADSTNHPGATAGGLMAAFAIGAVPIQVSWLQFGPWGCADESGFGVGALFNVNASFRYGISVDPKTGKRYMNELADRKRRADAMFIVIGKDKNYPINFCDSVAVKDIIPEQINKPLEAGILKKFDTLDALAAEYKIPADELKKTVERYNGFVKSGKDTDFGKPVDMIGGVTISTPPFYAMRGVPKLHHSMGGVKINTKAQVISIYDKKPIPGLYAAGEVTGGVHGASRLGSNAITDCLVFGMIAGENI
ncbi:flavocytochrome c, partial [Campylobacter sp.]|uniref:flavocytochrome c n=1 Tax=Campylobacter sp. TaxID=205 RepID=UPI00270CC116|nr:flavocytochrome c [Campylobacter sp.]